MATPSCSSQFQKPYNRLIGLARKQVSERNRTGRDSSSTRRLPLEMIKGLPFWHQRDRLGIRLYFLSSNKSTNDHTVTTLKTGVNGFSLGIWEVSGSKVFLSRRVGKMGACLSMETNINSLGPKACHRFAP